MPEKRSSWALLADMVDRPASALTNVVAYPRRRWVLPAAFAVIILTASVWLTAPLMAGRAEQLMSGQLAQLPAEQLARIQGQLAFFQSPLFIGATAAVSGVVGLFLGWLLQGIALYLGALIAGSDIEFHGVIAAIPWLNLPFVLETIVQTAYQLTKGELIVNQGLSYLVSTGKALEDARSFAYIALGQVTLFRLWHLLLVYTLLRAGARLDRGAAFGVMLAYAALAVSSQFAVAMLVGQVGTGF